MDGPVRSMSRMPTRVVGVEERRVRASWVEMEDLPTPPFPEQTMIMFLTCCKRRPTGVSVSEAILMEGLDVVEGGGEVYAKASHVGMR